MPIAISISMAADEPTANNDSAYRRRAIRPRGNISGSHAYIRRGGGIREANPDPRTDVASYHNVIAEMVADQDPVPLCKAGGSQRQPEEHQYRNIFHIRLLAPAVSSRGSGDCQRFG